MSLANSVLLQGTISGTTNATGVAATGNGNSLPVASFTSVVFDVVISATATVTFEAAGRTGTYVSLPAEQVNTGQYSTTATATGLYRASCAGFERVRARISSFTSGTVIVHGTATENPLIQLAGTRQIALRASAATLTTAETNLRGATFYVGDCVELDILLDVTALGTEAGDTLDVYIDGSFDGGTNWKVNLIHFPQVVGTGSAARYTVTLARNIAAATIINATSDAAANTARAIGFPDNISVRYTTVDAVTTGNLAFTFAVLAVGRRR